MSITHISPLRYPGGKFKLKDLTFRLFESNNLVGRPYYEPFLGGGGLALSLLSKGYVPEIYVNDLDVRIYSFWVVLTRYTQQLVNYVQNCQIDLETWNSSKQILANPEEFDIIEVGCATLFVNRTSRSGILSGGVIGGNQQKGKWKIDARFNKENLIKRIEFISSFSRRIHIFNEDAIYFLKDKVVDNAFIFLDPPYVEKSDKLYMNNLEFSYHIELAQYLKKLHLQSWIQTYDDHPLIHRLYQDQYLSKLSTFYHASRSYLANELIIFSDTISP